MVYFLAGLVILTLLLLARSLLAGGAGHAVGQAASATGGVIGLIVSALLTFYARSPIALPLFIISLLLLQGGFPRRQSPSGPKGRASQVTTRWLEMALDHDSGDMDGVVMRGRFRGRRLSDLDSARILELLGECGGADEDTARLLIAYLDRFHPDWRQAAGEDKNSSDRSAGMSVEEAYEVLGLSVGAGRAEIERAHRELMRRNHPDAGGSDWLAARINEARDLLLRRQAGG